MVRMKPEPSKWQYKRKRRKKMTRKGPCNSVIREVDGGEIRARKEGLKFWICVVRFRDT